MSVRVTLKGLKSRLDKLTRRAEQAVAARVAAETWTTTPPSKRGWYWRGDATSLQIVFVAVLPAKGKKPERVEYCEVHNHATTPVDETLAYWCGPVKAPRPLPC